MVDINGNFIHFIMHAFLPEKIHHLQINGISLIFIRAAKETVGTGRRFYSKVRFIEHPLMAINGCLFLMTDVLKGNSDNGRGSFPPPAGACVPFCCS